MRFRLELVPWTWPLLPALVATAPKTPAPKSPIAASKPAIPNRRGEPYLTDFIATSKLWISSRHAASLAQAHGRNDRIRVDREGPSTPKGLKRALSDAHT